MSKGNMLLGQARGKVGSLVFSRSNGKQVVRSRAEVVKNPQTETQMVQRIILNTIAQAYSKMSAIVDHSFEGLQPGLQCMSFFNSKNMDALRNKIKAGLADGQSYDDIYAFSPLNSSTFAPNAFILAKGTLPEVVATPAGSLNAEITGIPANTYGDVINALGLQRGDQMTFISVNGSYANGTTFHFARVILDPINDDMTQADLDTPFIVDGAINKPNGRNEGSFNSLAFSNSKITYSLTTRSMAGAAVIVSRKKADGTWMRSNASLNLGSDAGAALYPSLQACLDALVDNGLDALNSLYLNNSGTGRLQNQNVPESVTTISSATCGGTTLNPTNTTSVQSGNKEFVAQLSAVGDAKVGVFELEGSSPANHLGDLTISGLTASATISLGSSRTYGLATYEGQGSNPQNFALYAKVSTSL